MFVGRQRQAEVRRLEATYDQVRFTAEPHLVVYSAPPGWGKTRLVQEFYRSLAAQQPTPPYWPASLVPPLPDPTASGFLALANERKTVRHREMVVPPGASIPWLWLATASGRLGDGSLAPVLDNLTNQISRHLPHLIARLERRKLLTRATYRAIVSTVPLLDIVELAESAVEVGEALIDAHLQWRRERGHNRSERRVDDSDHPERGGHVYQMLETLVRSDNSTDGLPIVLVLDDAHNLDDASLWFLQNIMSSQLPVLAIATVWPEKRHERNCSFGRYLAEAATSTRNTTVELDPLPTDDLVSYVLSEAPCTDPQVAARLSKRAGGNPYALRLLLEVPRVRTATRHGRVTLSASEVDELDGGLSNLLGQHWAELSHGVRQILVAAAMLGESFLDEILVAGLGRLQLTESLDTAIASAWIRTTAGTLGTMEFVERLRFEVARDSVSDVLSPREQLQILTGALGAVRAHLAEEHSGNSRRMLLALHITLADAEVESDLVAAAASAYELGKRVRREHHSQDAIRYLQQAAGWYEQADRTSELVRCLIDLSNSARSESGDRADGEPAALRALELADRKLTADDELRVHARCALASAHRRREDPERYESSLCSVAQAEALLADLTDPSPEVLRHVMSTKAGILGSAGDYDGAARLARGTVAHCENHYGRLHPRTMGQLGDLAYFLRRAGLVEEAVGARRQVLLRSTELVAELGYLQTAGPRSNLAATLLSVGDDRLLDEVGQLVNEAYEVRCRAFGRDGTKTQIVGLVRCWHWIRQGLQAEQRGEQAAAEGLFERAAEDSGRIVLLRRSGPVGQLATALLRYGTALACQRLPAAVPHLEEAIHLRTDRLRQDRTFWEVQECARSLQWAHRRLGRSAEAQAVTRLYRLAAEDSQVAARLA